MGYPTKIATCCHCGSKAALRLDKGRQELACASCGAPLHDLKVLPRKAAAKPAISHAAPPAQPKAKPVAKKSGEREGLSVKSFGRGGKKSSKKQKKRKGWFGKRLFDMAEDVFDVVEDIFD